jgi:hypothetical protein
LTTKKIGYISSKHGYIPQERGNDINGKHFSNSRNGKQTCTVEPQIKHTVSENYLELQNEYRAGMKGGKDEADQPQTPLVKFWKVMSARHIDATGLRGT